MQSVVDKGKLHVQSRFHVTCPSFGLAVAGVVGMQQLKTNNNKRSRLSSLME